MTNPRIHDSITCSVCGDNSSGKHYDVHTCDGCASFFKRTVRQPQPPKCKYSEQCEMSVTKRNDCRGCRWIACLRAGMRSDFAQSDRGPRTAVAASNQQAQYNQQPMPVHMGYAWIPQMVHACHMMAPCHVYGCPYATPAVDPNWLIQINTTSATHSTVQSTEISAEPSMTTLTIPKTSTDSNGSISPPQVASAIWRPF